MMQFQAKAGALNAAVARVLPAVQRRNTIPILSNIHLGAANDVARLTATDMDLELSATVDASVTANGAVTVPAVALSRFLSVIGPDDAVSVRQTEDGVEVASEEASIMLVALPAEDFPDTRLGAEGAAAIIPAAALAKALRCTTYAISREETRYYLNGVHMRRKAGVLTFEATDGHRLVQYGVPDVEGAAFTESAIMPRVPAQLLRNAVERAKPEDVVSIIQCGGGMAVSLPGGVTMRAKAIDGTFPDVERVIPDAREPEATIDRRRLLRALDVAASICGGATSRTAAVLYFDGTRLTVSAKDPNYGEAKSACPMAYTGKPLQIGFSQQYLREFLRTALGDTVTCIPTGASEPAKWLDPATPEAVSVLMPMRV